MREGKIAIIEEEAELVRLIFRRYLELGSVNESKKTKRNLGRPQSQFRLPIRTSAA
jgi:hypothetical protein